MPLLIKVDEDLPEEIADILNAAGHDAVTVRSQGWSGIPDAELWLRIQAENRWLVTADKEFGDIRKFVPAPGAGIVLIRAEVESRRQYLALATALLRSFPIETAAGCLVVVTPRGVRVRRLRPPRAP